MVIFKYVRRGLYKFRDGLRFMFRKHPCVMNVASAAIILPMGDLVCQSVNMYLGDVKHYNFKHTRNQTVDKSNLSASFDRSSNSFCSNFPLFY